MKNLHHKLETLVSARLGDTELAQIILYALFPAGKLFRPQLALALASDLGSVSEDHYLLAAALEAHHVYSLIHDDLPCMDNDDERRGRPATHIKYGEWKALLAGDALINVSFELLASMEHPATKQIIADFARMMGPQGLILGQFIDLSDQNKSLDETLFMHELKTGRLIQFALMASRDLSSSNEVSREEVERLGRLMGINFQLLDDLGELTESTDEREGEVNAFLNYKAQEVLAVAIENNQQIASSLKKLSLKGLENIYEEFLQKTRTKINAGIKQVAQSSGLDESALLELF